VGSGWRTIVRATALIASVAVTTLFAAPATRTFTGVITDDMCPRADHSRMRMGPTDAECVKACIDAHGAMYVLFDGEHAFTLSDQHTPERFAAQHVRVVGTLDEKAMTIAVDSIAAAR
jgi:hypothetical protein